MFMDSDSILYSDIETVQEGQDPTVIFLLHREYSESLNKKYDYLDCPICFEELNDDKRVIFDCNHELCVVCLGKIIEQTTKKDKNLLCPICRNKVCLLKTKTENLNEVYSNLIYHPCMDISHRGIRVYSQFTSMSVQKHFIQAFCVAGLIVFFVLMTSNSSHNLDT